MASPHPQPTAIKEARGNPGKRALNKNEPKPSREMPQAPAKLSPAARAYWDKLAPEAHRVGVLTKLDAAAFARYCSNLADHDACEEFIREHGIERVSIDTTTGEVLGVVPYPHSNRKIKLEELLFKYEDRFGLNPSARTKINTDPGNDGDELDQLLNQPLRIAK